MELDREWIGTISVSLEDVEPTRPPRYPPPDARRSRPDGLIGRGYTVVSHGFEGMEIRDFERGLRMSIWSETRQSITLMGDEDTASAETRRVNGQNRLSELRSRLAVYQEEGAARKRKRGFSFSKERVKGIWGHVKRRSMI